MTASIMRAVMPDLEQKFDIHRFDQLKRTQSTAKFLADQGVQNFAVITEDQTEGYGRIDPNTNENRKWRALPGDLTISFAVSTKSNNLVALSFATAKATADIVRPLLADQESLFFARPYSLHIHDKNRDIACKVGNVIVEHIDPNQPNNPVKIIGVGLNIAAGERDYNPDKSYRPISMSEIESTNGKPVNGESAATIADKILGSIQAQILELEERGLETIMRDMKLLPTDGSPSEIFIDGKNNKYFREGYFSGFDASNKPGFHRIKFRDKGTGLISDLDSNDVTFLRPGREDHDRRIMKKSAALRPAVS